MLKVFENNDADYVSRFEALCHRQASVSDEIDAAARQVIAEVRAGGDEAVRALTAKFEKRELGALELSASEWDTMAARATPQVRAALEHAARRVRAFYERERHPSYEIDEGPIRTGSRVDPLDRVGIYVPGGTARYPSTVIMTAIPAQVAGVREIVMVTPGPSAETLLAARLAGVARVFVIGGAQAIAALAYGTESVPRVDKIVGPGNAYVAAAKRLVFGDVGIDSIAGPTERGHRRRRQRRSAPGSPPICWPRPSTTRWPFRSSRHRRRLRPPGGRRGGAPGGAAPAARDRREGARAIRAPSSSSAATPDGRRPQPAGARARRAGRAQPARAGRRW